MSAIIVFTFFAFAIRSNIGTDALEHLACNEKLCANGVSKCLLTKYCVCGDFATNLTCAKDCTKCLGSLYQDCCSCLDLCQPSPIPIDPMSRSNYELIFEPDIEIFELLSREQAVKENNWHMYNVTYRVQIDFDFGGEEIGGLEDLTESNTNRTDNSTSTIPIILPNKNDGIIEVNCTIAFLSQCMAFNKCKENCAMMGASAYRWFHNACCQCIGPCGPRPFGEEQPGCDLCHDPTVEEIYDLQTLRRSNEDESNGDNEESQRIESQMLADEQQASSIDNDNEN